ncbi:MAG: PEP/pyruvate-binding domain-containing protein [Bacteriovorax sp.]
MNNLISSSASLGGKANSLIKLKQCGFPVPKFEIIPIEIFKKAQDLNFNEIPSEFHVHFDKLISGLGEVPVAVRSSASKEDGSTNSFAGLFETYLNVLGREEIAASVLKCWRSTKTERIQKYCERNNLDVNELEMAVVIQEYIEPDFAGVIFTVNPITGNDQELIIEACHGSGEKLVSGLITPSRFTLKRAEKNFVHEREDVLNIKPDESLLKKLQMIALEIQAQYGCPQDIEFAVKNQKIYILQSRPVTKIQFGKEMGEWTTSDFRDGGVSSAVVSPVMWSLYEKIFATTLPEYFVKLKLIDEKAAKDIVWYKVFYGRPYWNLRAVKDIQETLPGYVERNFDQDMALPINYEGDGVTTGVTIKGILKALPVLGALHKEYDNQKKRSVELIETFSKIEDHYLSLNLKEFSDEQLFESFRTLVLKDFTYIESEYFQTIYNASNAKLEFSDELKFYKTRDSSLEFVNLISELGELKVTGPAHFLRDLAISWQKKSPRALESLEHILNQQKDPITLKDLEHDEFLHSEFSEFYKNYYFHSERELDLLVPRWGEDLRFALLTLHTLLKAPMKPLPEHKVYEKEMAKLRAAHKKSWRHFVPGQWSPVMKKLERIRYYLWLREEVRDRSTRMYYFIRLHLLEIGERTKLGELIFHLSYQEIISFTEGKCDLEELGERARMTRLYALGFKHFKNSNEIGFRFNNSSWKAKSKITNGKTSYFGIGCSAGVLQAKASVIKDISEASKLKAGEIMVVPFTDPGWTPLFSLASGVVTETGGLLSHAALISREYGIPCVLNVNGATEQIRDQANIEIDGNEGRVTIL